MPDRDAYHERLDSQEPLPSISNRIFGITFAAVFTVIGLIPLIFREPPRLWAFAIAAALLLLAIAVPQALAPLNRVWSRVRIVLNAVLTFVLMGLLFYGVVLPTGLIMRALRKDLLNLRYDADARSYWIERDPPGPDPESMNRQF